MGRRRAVWSRSCVVVVVEVGGVNWPTVIVTVLPFLAVCRRRGSARSRSRWLCWSPSGLLHHPEAGRRELADRRRRRARRSPPGTVAVVGACGDHDRRPSPGGAVAPPPGSGRSRCRLVAGRRFLVVVVTSKPAFVSVRLGGRLGLAGHVGDGALRRAGGDRTVTAVPTGHAAPGAGIGADHLAGGDRSEVCVRTCRPSDRPDGSPSRPVRAGRPATPARSRCPGPRRRSA